MDEARRCLEEAEAHLAAGRLREADAALRAGLDALDGEGRSPGAGTDAGGSEAADLLAADLHDALCRLSLDVGEDLAAEHHLAVARRLRDGAAGPMSPAAGRSWFLQARLHLLADRDPRRAADACERARRLLRGTPDLGRAWALLGRCRLALDEHDAAAEALETALSEDPPPDERAAVLTDLARTRAAQGQHERALAVVHERVALVHAHHGPSSPEAADTLLLLAGLSETAGDLESAVSALERAVDLLADLLSPTHQEVTMARAYLLALQSRLAGADLPPEDAPEGDGVGEAAAAAQDPPG